MRNRSKSCFISPDKILKECEINVGKEFEENFDEETFKKIIFQIKEQIPNDDNIPFEERIQKIKWKKVQYNDKSYKQIKSFFLSLVDKVRKYRILPEILDDVTKIFQKEKQATKCELNEVLEKFHLDVPKKKKTPTWTPFYRFYDSIKDKVKYNEARKMYTRMGNKEKISWILKYLNVKDGEMLNLEQYERAKQNLTHTEMELIDEYERKPKKELPAFNKFVKTYMQKIKEGGTELNSMTIFKQAAEAWKNIPEIEKQKLQEEANRLKAQYEEDLKKFLNALPEDRKNNTVTSKNNSKSFLPIETNKKQKKRKISVENGDHDQKNNSVAEKENQNDILSIMDNKSKICEANWNGSVTKISKNSLSLIEDCKPNENKIKSKKRSLQNKSLETEEPIPKKGKKLNKNKDKRKSENQEETGKTKPVFDMEKPPDSLYKYYKHYVYKGDKSEAKSIYKSMNDVEKDKLLNKYEKLQKKFLRKYQEYLNTLSVEEVENIQENNSNNETNDDIKSSDESDYESD